MVLPIGLVGVLSVVSANAHAQAASEAALQTRLKEVQASPATADTSYKLGAKLSTICANCHGKSGISVTPDTPNLASQNAAYMIAQMVKFGDGRRRNDFMQGLIKTMSLEEKVAVIHYFSKQPASPRGKTTDPLYAAGKSYYDKICFRCHGADGMGDDKVPRIAGQQSAYMALALKRYRDGSVVRGDPLMEANTRNMSDADIQAVAAYVSAMR